MPLAHPLLVTLIASLILMPGITMADPVGPTDSQNAQVAQIAQIAQVARVAQNARDSLDPADPPDPLDPLDPLDPIDPLDPPDPIRPLRNGNLSGEVAFETRAYFERPAYVNQDSQSLIPSVRLETRYVAEIPRLGNARLTLLPRLRWDALNHHSGADLLEANLLWVGQDWDFVAGIDRRFWGVTESRNPVDILNQIDWVDGPDSQGRLGQPMLNLNRLWAQSQLGVFILPRFLPRDFGKTGARLQGPFAIDSRPQYASSRGADHIDYALRYRHTLGPADLGISYFDGTRRDPRFRPRIDPATAAVILTPYYEQITQWGLDLQIVRGPWHWKLEAITQDGEEGRYQAAVGGFEYAWPGFAGSRIDLGLLAEYLYDGDPGTMPAPVFNDDLFLGLRLTFNDTRDSRLLLGTVVDRKHRSSALGIEGQRRLGQQWRLDLDSRLLFNVAEEDPLNFVARDSYIKLRLGYFF